MSSERKRGLKARAGNGRYKEELASIGPWPAPSVNRDAILAPCPSRVGEGPYWAVVYRSTGKIPLQSMSIEAIRPDSSLT